MIIVEFLVKMSFEVDYNSIDPCPFCNSRIDEFNFCACGGNLGISQKSHISLIVNPIRQRVSIQGYSGEHYFGIRNAIINHMS